MNPKKDARPEDSWSQSKAPMIEWQVCEDERDWQMAQMQPHENLKAEVPRQRWAQRGLLRWGVPFLLVVLVLVLAGGWWLWGQAQRGLDEIEGELEAAVISELWSATPKYGRATRALQEPIAQNTVKLQEDVGKVIRQLEILNLGKDWAVIEVLIQPTVAGPTYRQTRVYQHSDRGWIQVEATAAHWGVARHLESDYFVFHYYALDEKAVIQAAAQLDALYLALNASFGGHAPGAEKLTIRVDPEWVPEKVLQLSRPQQAGVSEIVVASPTAMLVPADLIPSDVLLQSLVLSLFSHFTEDSAAYHRLSSRDMYNGLRLWLIWENEFPLAIWRKPLVKWVFDHSQSTAGQRAFAAPEFAHDLCEHHKLWVRSPIHIGVPVQCWSQDGGEEKIVAWRFRQPLLKIPLALLIDMPVPLDTLSMWHQLPEPEPAATAVALATTLEYVASTYGAERVPLLLAAVPEHERAETLIQAVFGLPLAEFESGWQDFLQEEYEIVP